FSLAGAPIGVLAGLALRLSLGAGGILLFLDPVILDPSQLSQRKQDRVLTWTLAAAHRRGLTISVTRFSVCFNAGSFSHRPKIMGDATIRSRTGGRGRSAGSGAYLNDASNLSTTSSPFLLPPFAGAFLSSVAPALATVVLAPAFAEPW